MTVVIEAVHQQFVSAGAGAVADYYCTRVEPVFDLAVNRDAQLRARWREEYRTWMEAPIAHCTRVTATSLPRARPTTELESGTRFAE